MKKKIAALLLAAAGLLSNACEQHKWSETQKLFQEPKTEHSEKGSAEHGEAGKDEKKPATTESKKD
jgi:hypothetical protein